MFKNLLCMLWLVACPSLADDFIIPDNQLFESSIFQNSRDCNTKDIAKIDLLFVAEPHLSGLERKTNYWVASINKFFKDSAIYARVRKAGLVYHDFSAQQMRSKLTELKENADLQNYRNEYKADLVQGIIEGRGAMGIGFISTSPEFAFSVVRPHVTPLTVAHEVGHNLGLGHSVLQGSKGIPYPWGRGHGIKDQFGTIMTYSYLYPAPRTHKFSNPKVKCSGLPCGVKGNHSRSANSALAINCVRFHVSRHR